jgi:uncharacterized protein YigE (DUF2233 family)
VKNFVIMAAATLLAVPLSSCQDQAEGQPIATIDISGSSSTNVSEAADGGDAVPTASSACSLTDFEGVVLTHCVADPAKHRIAMAHSSAQDTPYGSFAALAQAEQANDIAFAMNGGMFDPDGLPVGYYVEAGNRLSELDRTDGEGTIGGNFYLRPNGVFYGTGGNWVIKDTESFYRTVSDRPEFGTQSGPMLVVDGKMHPEIQDNGPSKAIRNGVGIDTAGKAHFVISETPLSFGQLARFFRDVLKTPNALYLDGSISALWDPAKDRMDNRGAIGPMVMVENIEGSS